MPRDTALPVVVIGGGPVGLSLAMELRYHGVGFSRNPPERLRPGSLVDTTISGIGTLTTRVTGR